MLEPKSSSTSSFLTNRPLASPAIATSPMTSAIARRVAGDCLERGTGPVSTMRGNYQVFSGAVEPETSATPSTLAELEAAARARLPAIAWDYYAGGADDEVTLRANAGAYRRLALAYRVLVDVATRDLATTVLGDRIAMPIVVAPTAFHRLAHPDGELASVRAAGAAGTVFVL